MNDISKEVAFVRVCYKLPEAADSKLIEKSVSEMETFDKVSADVRFAVSVSVSVVGFDQNMKNSKFKGDWSNADIKSIAQNAKGSDTNGARSEFIQLIDIMNTIKPTSGI